MVIRIALMAFDCVRGQRPGFIDGAMAPVHIVTARARLRSADQGDVVVPGSRSIHLDSVSAASPH